MSNAQKFIILIGALIILIGILWPYISKFPLFRLPGDIVVNKPNFKLFIPITTMIIISVLLTLFFWIIRKFFNWFFDFTPKSLDILDTNNYY